jgi:hypothetical protein
MYATLGGNGKLQNYILLSCWLGLAESQKPDAGLEAAE